MAGNMELLNSYKCFSIPKPPNEVKSCSLEKSNSAVIESSSENLTRTRSLDSLINSSDQDSFDGFSDSDSLCELKCIAKETHCPEKIRESDIEQLRHIESITESVRTSYLEKSHKSCDYENCGFRKDTNDTTPGILENDKNNEVPAPSAPASVKNARRNSIANLDTRMETIPEEPIEPKILSVKEILARFETMRQESELKAIVNGNGKNALASPTHNVAEVYKISESEHVMSALEKDAPISKNVKPAGIASHQHQESIAYSKEQSSPTQTSVVKHSLLQFALQHFRYDVPEESNKIRPEKRTSHERSHAANLVKWQGSLLETPLLKLPMDLNNLALECFECILRYCGDLPPDVNCSEVKCVYTVLMHCHKHLILRDEVYCQLMKQTTANRSSLPDSSQRAWRLLSILAAYFGCSESLKPYLIEHLTSATTDRKGTAAAVCLTNLRKTARCGGRKNVPSVEEVTAVSAGRSARRQIYRLPGGAERVVNTRCSTVVQDVISELCSLLGVESEAEQLEFSLYCIVQGDAFTMPLCSDEYILDVTTELLKTNQPFYLIFCRSIWHFPLKKNPQPTPLYVEVLFNQVAPDYLEGLLLEIPNIGTPSLDYIRDIARIAAILHRAADLNHIPVMKEIKFLLPKPALGLRELKPAQWVNLVQTEFIKVLVMTPLQCKAEFLNVLSAWPLFGSSFFAVKRVYGDDIGGIPDDENGIIARELILALNRRGVLFLDSNTHETLHHWHFIEIISTRKVRSEDALYLDMKVGNLLQQNVIRVQTEQAHEISRIIRQYISMASTKDE